MHLENAIFIGLTAGALGFRLLRAADCLQASSRLQRSM
jgi:hypothetical protein